MCGLGGHAYPKPHDAAKGSRAAKDKAGTTKDAIMCMICGFLLSLHAAALCRQSHWEKGRENGRRGEGKGKGKGDELQRTHTPSPLAVALKCEF